MTKINKCLIVGLGKMGLLYDYGSKTKYSLTHVSSINKSNFFSLYGIVDSNKKIREKCEKTFNIKTFSNLEDVDDKNFDLIIVSTPTSTHYKVIKEILLKFSPKVILAEKPFTNNYSEAKKISQIALKKKIKIFVNYSRITDISSSILKKKIEKAPYSNCKIFYSKSILNNGSHFINLLQFFFGKVIKHELISNIKNSYLLKFKNSEAILTKKKLGRTNNLLIKNKKFVVDYRFKSNKIYVFKNNQKKEILSYNKNLNFFVIKNLENFLKKKNYRLCTLKQALETHKFLQPIKKY